MPIRILVAVMATALVACGGPQATPDEPPGEAELSAAEQSELVALVRDYANEFGCVDDLLRWAPTMCRAPLVTVRMSAADGEGAHARKLYWLFAKDREAYVGLSEKQGQPVGQVLVKEAWVPESGDATDDTPGPYGGDSARRPPRLKRSVEQDGQTWHPGTKHALFVMWKRDPKTPNTDAGWTYATLTPDGTRVTAGGKLSTCMECHRDATHDRLFGLPRAQ